MLTPTTHAWSDDEALGGYLGRRGISRRDFIEFCGQMAAVLGLSSLAVPRIAEAMESLQRPTVIWLQLQECTGCVESVIRSSDPTIGDLVLDVISLDFMDTLMAAAGTAAEKALDDSRKKNAGKYVLIVTGSVPTKEHGIYTMIGGKTARSLLEETARDAAAVIAVGACAHWGSVQASKPNPTGAVGVSEIVKDKPVLNIAGCPPIADVITATVVHFLTFGRLPETDADGRPLFAYGKSIHDNCERRAHFDAGQYVERWGDEGHRTGYCLYKMGCKGPVTHQNCPVVRWNEGTSWPIGCGHPCVGCAEPQFWDRMTPFYRHLAGVPGFGVGSDLDKVGLTGVGVVGAAFAAHGLVNLARRTAEHRAERHALEPAHAAPADKEKAP